jgi:ADP-heptose:LPS heptosyltransferase
VPEPRRLILVNHLSPGDVLVMTAAIHSLHRANPGQFEVAVDTTAQAFWEHNPDVVSLDQARQRGFEVCQTHYPAVNECNQRAIHFLQAYCEFLADNLRVPCPLATNRPMIWLSEQEKAWLPQVHEVTGRAQQYWVLNAGTKSDYTAKHWGKRNYQRLVDLLRGRVQFVQVGKGDNGHSHPDLDGVVDLRGKTDDRQLVRLLHHAQGAVGGTTLLMHLAAASKKPYVCILGGREPVPWNAYPLQQTLHTVGLLSCCREGGCWRSRTVPLGDNDQKDGSLCEQPVPGDPPIPRCLEMIRPEAVAEAVLRCCSG